MVPALGWTHKTSIRIWTVWIYSRKVFSGSLRKRLNGFEWVYLAEWQETVKGSLALSGAFGGKKEKCQEIPGFLMDFADDANISGRTRRCLACSEWHLSQECHLHVHPIGQRTEIAWSIGTAELGPQAKKKGFRSFQKIRATDPHQQWPTTGADKGPMLQFQHEVLGHHPFNRIPENRHNAATSLSLGKLLGIVVFLKAFL